MACTEHPSCGWASVGDGHRRRDVVQRLGLEMWTVRVGFGELLHHLVLDDLVHDVLILVEIHEPVPVQPLHVLRVRALLAAHTGQHQLRALRAELVRNDLVKQLSPIPRRGVELGHPQASETRFGF